MIRCTFTPPRVLSPLVKHHRVRRARTEDPYLESKMQNLRSRGEEGLFSGKMHYFKRVSRFMTMQLFGSLDWDPQLYQRSLIDFLMGNSWLIHLY